MLKRLMLVFAVLLVSAMIALAQEPLTLGQLVSVNINADAQAPSLVFPAAAGQRLSVQVASTSGSLFPIFTIYTMDGEILQYTGNPARSPLLEGVVVIPMDAEYRLELWNLDSVSGQVIVLVEDITPGETELPAGTTPQPTVPAIPTAIATSAEAAGCTLTSDTSLPVNVREGPSTVFRAIAAMPPGGTYPVSGRDNPNDWYQITINGINGWVAASVTRLEGDCGTIEVLAIRIPTLTPTPTPTPTATYTPTAIPTHTATPQLGLAVGTPNS